MGSDYSFCVKGGRLARLGRSGCFFDIFYLGFDFSSFVYVIFLAFSSSGGYFLFLVF